MSGASIETTLELWASSLRDVKRRMRPLFTQARVALSAENFLEGLLGEKRRKTGSVLGVKSNQPFHSWGKPQEVAGTAKDIADAPPASAWRRLSAGAGTKGERLHDWACLELADLEAG